MQCLDKKVLLDYLNDELPKSKQRQIKDHLAMCAHCRKELGIWQLVLQKTAQFVEEDMSNHPTPPHAHITQRFKKMPEKKKTFSFLFHGYSDTTVPGNSKTSIWIRSWVKPAIVTACAVVASVMIYFVVPKSSTITPSNSYVIDNGYNTETVTLSEESIENLETYYLQEIYENSELREEILYGDWQNYDDQLQNLDEDEIEDLINELYNEQVT